MPRGRAKGATYTSATRRLMIAALLMVDVPERAVVRVTGAARETVREVHRTLKKNAEALLKTAREKPLKTPIGRTVTHAELVLRLARRAAFELVHHDGPAAVLAKLAGVVQHPEHLPAVQRLMKKAKREEERCKAANTTS